MYGAILGDILGSIYEGRSRNLKTEQPEEIDLFHPRCRFTDDTVLTFAVAEAAMGDRDYKSHLVKWANRHPHAGYGGGFKQWFHADDPQPYNSFGNGSAMRVSAIGWTCKSLDEVLVEAKRSAEVSHNHPEGIKGAQAVAAAVYLAQINSKEDIKAYIEETFGYDLGRTIDEIRPNYRFDVSCQGSVPEAIIAFLESRDFVHAIQLAISIGGDSDTIACITGAIAEAFYRKIPDEYIRFAHEKLSDEMKPLLHAFCRKYTKADKSAFPEFYAAAEEEKKRKREEEEQRRMEKKQRREREWQTNESGNYNDGILAQFKTSDFPNDASIYPYERYHRGEFYACYPEVAFRASQRMPLAEPIPLEDTLYLSLLFTWVPENVYVQINPLAAGYEIGILNDMPDQHCRVIDGFYSDQSQMQYLYNAFIMDGIVYFSLLVAAFKDEYIEDNRDPNRQRFLEYFRDPESWLPLIHWEEGHGYFKLDFVSPPQPAPSHSFRTHRTTL